MQQSLEKIDEKRNVDFSILSTSNSFCVNTLRTFG